MKTEIMQKIIEKQDELIKMISPHGAEFWGSDSDKYLRLTNDIASLKSQLAEAGEEKRNKLIKAYSDLVIEIDKHKGTTIKEIKLRNKIANLKLEIR